jgi:Protein of unknown function (DUF1800)
MPNSRSILITAAAVLLAAGAAQALAALACTPSGGAPPPTSPEASPPVAGADPHPQTGWRSLDVRDARHVLDRFSFGPRSGEPEALASAGLEPWLSEQLALPTPPDAALEAALEPHREGTLPAVELVQRWLGPDALAVPLERGELEHALRPHFREHLAHLAGAELGRHILSHQQLREVMVDFWSNHFNVYAPKGVIALFVGDYVEQVLRPLALGRFEDLLIATARHPAMLIYLDNASNSSKAGANENYARELLELHTLGVAGGYTQGDVADVARILTGWSVTRPGQRRVGTERPFEFVFRKGRHDPAAKQVLGLSFPPGGGEEEGLRLLRFLAAQPATARHLATKLCARFVADAAPASCVRAAEHAYLESDGSLQAVLTAILHEQSFWSEGVRARKLKTPLEFVVSALRAVDAHPDATPRLTQALRRLGEPLFEESIPTGYPESEAAWASSGGFMNRMNFATALASGRLEGVQIELPRTLPEDDALGLVAHGNRAFLSNGASQQTLAAIAAGLQQQARPERRRTLAAALFLGSPEFQSQ